MALLSVLLGFALAGAPIALSWTAPEECPDQAEVLREVELLTEGRAQPALQAEAVAQAVPGGYAARLTTRQGEAIGERLLNAESCAELAKAAALVLAMAVGREVRVQPVPAPAPRPGLPPFLFFARPMLGGELGALSSPSALFGVSAGLMRGRVRAELRAFSSVAQRLEKGPKEGAAAELRRFSAGLRGCYIPAQGQRLAFGLCAGGEVVSLTGRGVGVSDPQEGSALLVAARGGACLELALTERLFLHLDAAGGPASSRPAFAFEGFGVVHRPAAWTAEATAGLEVRL